MSSEQATISQIYDFVIKVVEEKVKEIKVSREEFDKLVKSVRRLTMAVRRLTRAQKKTDERLQQLSQEVQKLASEVKNLAVSVRNLSVAVGRLSDVVGFGLEDIARVMVPGWLERHEGIFVEDLQPKFFFVDGEEIQINLYGVGSRNTSEVVIIGECRSRIYHHDVRKFAELVEKIRPIFGGKPIFAFIFGYLIHPRAEMEAKNLGIHVLATYMR